MKYRGSQPERTGVIAVMPQLYQFSAAAPQGVSLAFCAPQSSSRQENPEGGCFSPKCCEARTIFPAGGSWNNMEKFRGMASATSGLARCHQPGWSLALRSRGSGGRTARNPSRDCFSLQVFSRETGAPRGRSAHLGTRRGSTGVRSSCLLYASSCGAFTS